MATTKTVSGKLTGFDSSNKGTGAVVITPSQACTIPGTQELLPNKINGTVASDGTWTVQLYSNNDLTPTGTFYTVEEMSPDGGYQKLTIQVPQTAGPFVVTNITTSTPTASPTPNHVSTLTVDALTAGQVIYADTAGLVATDSTFTFNKTTKVAGASALSVTGLTGATAPGRYVGNTTSGAPTTGTFLVGDWVKSNASGSVFVCTVAGTPGTWQVAGKAYNVQDYNAKGDGSTNDSSAIQSAIDAATAAGGGVVFFPPATYMCNIVAKPNVTLLGAGPGLVVLKSVASSGLDVIQGQNFATLTNTPQQHPELRGCNYVTLVNLTIDGNKGSNAAGYGIRIWGRVLRFENVRVRNCVNDGIWTEFTLDLDPNQSDMALEGYFENIRTETCGGNGWTFWGPHDSVILDYTTSQNTGLGFVNNKNANSSGILGYGSGWDAWGNAGGCYQFNTQVGSIDGIIASGTAGIGIEIGASLGIGRFDNINIGGLPIGMVARGSQMIYRGVVTGCTTDAIQIAGGYDSLFDFVGVGNKNVFNVTVAEANANIIRGRFDIPAASTLTAGTFHTYDTIDLYGAGAGGTQVLFQLPSNISGGLRWDSTGTFSLLKSSGGAQVGGSLNGYTDEITFSNAGGAATALTSMGIAGTYMAFDIRGTNNVGSWRWRNGTAAGSTAMNLDSNGALTPNAVALSNNATLAAAIAPDLKVAQVYAPPALAANQTVAAPLNPKAGEELVFVWLQDATGGRTITYNAVFKTGGAVAMVTTASTATIDRFVYDGTNWRILSRVTGQ